jgi:hypothetical protein
LGGGATPPGDAATGGVAGACTGAGSGLQDGSWPVPPPAENVHVAAALHRVASAAGTAPQNWLPSNDR